MPLQILIIGAGIAGLTAAASLRQAGHSIFEKSAFAAETGAALVLAPNGSHVLSSLGFSFERARACRMQCWETRAGNTLEQLSCISLDKATERFGQPVWTIHRVDLHNELLRLALEGPGGAKLHLSSQVVHVNPEQGILKLADGSQHRGDLIVAADGLRSVARSLVTDVPSSPVPTGLSAFRFLVPSEKLQSSSLTAAISRQKSKGVTIIPDTTDTVHERHAVWYECRGGDVQNFVGIHPTRAESLMEGLDYKRAMLAEFSHFHPGLLELFKNAEDVKCWPLFVHEPLHTWVRGKLVLIGDAAHPMLPFGGQGSNQAIEDGGALGLLLENVHDQAVIADRLRLFEILRKDRASRVQILSRVRVGNERQVERELKQYTKSSAEGDHIPSVKMRSTA